MTPPRDPNANAKWNCPNGDHACNLRGHCLNPNCDLFMSPMPASLPATSAQADRAEQLARKAYSLARQGNTVIQNEIALLIRTALDDAVREAQAEITNLTEANVYLKNLGIEWRDALAINPACPRHHRIADSFLKHSPSCPIEPCERGCPRICRACRELDNAVKDAEHKAWLYWINQ